MKAYVDDEDIVRHGKSAILSMSALENLSKSAAIAAQAKQRKVAEEAPKDVLAAYRCGGVHGPLCAVDAGVGACAFVWRVWRCPGGHASEGAVVVDFPSPPPL
jgi:hypothetical protein